jgi:hypothetical protein
MKGFDWKQKREARESNAISAGAVTLREIHCQTCQAGALGSVRE